jgi:hypothetical protein
MSQECILAARVAPGQSFCSTDDADAKLAAGTPSAVPAF